ncbi:hypothetical protein R6Q57_012516 [Mikania cordata]
MSPARQPRIGKLKPIWEMPPPGSKMPPLETIRLTKEMVQERVKDDVIIATFGNYAFKDFILTWVKHLTDLGVENLLVGGNGHRTIGGFILEGCAEYFSKYDVFLEQNPLPYLARYSAADVLTSTDQVTPTATDDRFDNWQQGENCSSNYIKN